MLPRLAAGTAARLHHALSNCIAAAPWAATANAADGPSCWAAGAGGSARGLHLAPPFLVEDYVPVATTTYRLGRMKGKVERALEELKACRACPRDCGVNRLAGQTGTCMVGRNAVAATIAPHYGEEGCLQGWLGSGTVFFSGCSMRCVFCQNWDISHRPKGFELTADELAGWMMRLQEEGKVHNINLVTPEHVVPQVVEALALAVERGLSLPVVYNTSGYDSVASIELLDGLVDIYMPDFKFWTSASSEKYARAADYPEVARAAIKAMHRQVGDLVFDPSTGLAKRGLLLRHLAMPGQAAEGREVLAWAARELGRDTFVNVMGQYHPAGPLLAAGEQRSRLGRVTYEEIHARPPESEVEALVAYGRQQGLWRFEEAPRYEAAGEAPAAADGELRA